MARVSNRLTDRAIKALREPGLYGDGGNLFVRVAPGGSKQWKLRATISGKRCDIGLGGYPSVSLAAAREKAADVRKAIAEGRDPIAEQRRAKGVPTFEVAAKAVHKEHQKAWKNGKHQDQWINTLRDYAFPLIGDRRVDQVDSADVLKVLAPIWLDKAETARRVKQRIKTVLDWCRVNHYRRGENPIEGIAKALPRQPRQTRHHPALNYEGMPQFIEQLRACNSNEIVRLAFELTILCATRTSETLLARPEEFDLDSAVWLIPSERMKAGQEHRIPLAPRAIEIVRRAKELTGDEPFLFPGRKRGNPLSAMTFLMTIRRMKRANITAHGMRAAFKTWASEKTSFPREIIETALAHTIEGIEGKVAGAYMRGDLFEKRRRLMTAWATFATTLRAG